MKNVAIALTLLVGLVGNAHAKGDAEAGKAKSTTCMACHGAQGNKTLLNSYPKLAGQHADYIVKQLKEFKSGVRKDPTMAGMVAALSGVFFSARLAGQLKIARETLVDSLPHH